MTLPAEPDGFFGRDNLHRAGWAAVVGICGFVGALIYYRMLGPQKVVIDTSAPAQTPLTVTLKDPLVAPQGPSASDIQKLAAAIQGLQPAHHQAQDDPRIAALTAEVQRLSNSLTRKPEARSPTLVERQPNASGTNGALLRTTPSALNPEGRSPLIGSVEMTCPPSTVEPGAELAIGFRLVDPTIHAQASDLVLRIDRAQAPTKFVRAGTFGRNLVNGYNGLIVSLSTMDPGDYRVSYGFYIRSEQVAGLPIFYSHECKVRVVGRVRQ